MSKDKKETVRKKKRRGCPKIFRHPLLGLLILITGISTFLLRSVLPDSTYVLGELSAPEIVTELNGDMLSVYDDFGIYFYNKNDLSFDHMICPAVLEPNGYPFMDSVAQGEGDHIYAHVYLIGETDEVEKEYIAEFDGKGKMLRQLVTLYYGDTDRLVRDREPRIRTLDCKDGDLLYVYTYEDENNIVRIGEDGTTLDVVKIDCPEGLGISEICATDDGYAAILTDLSVVNISMDGELECIAYPDFSREDFHDSEGFYPKDIFFANGKVYVTAGSILQSIYVQTDEGFEYYRNTEYYLGEAEDYFFNHMIRGITGVDGNLYISVDDCILIDKGGSFEIADTDFDIPFKYMAMMLLKFFLPFIGIPLILYGLTCDVAFLLGYRDSIMFKLLKVLMPTVLIMFAILSAVLIYNTYKINRKNTSDALKISGSYMAEVIDGDEIKEFDRIDTDMAIKCHEYSKKLTAILEEIGGEWAKTSDIYLMVPDGNGGLVSLVCSPQNNMPVYSMAYESDFMLEETDDKIIEYTSQTDDGSEYEDVFIRIYDSDGDMSGVLVVSTAMYYVREASIDLIKKAVLAVGLFSLVMVFFVWLICLYISRSLSKAGAAISKVAAGDFDAHIEDISDDEIGVICSGVNEMAEQLRNMFVQKDKNERFYYKFVPEQFRELLHKESITDLALGDAESTDLTVLFCDIRSFSLNSEMMTAKENFEFVNVIYGIAGPIVRKHGGFVDKYIGDAVMALFQNADDAIAAGKELYSSIVLDKGTAEHLGMSSINIGVGIHSGMARIGIVGEDERMSGTVISNTVNISSRLESLTKQYHTAMIITKDTLDRMTDPDSLQIRYLGMVQVAGVNEVKAIYEVLDALDSERREERIRTRDDFKEGVRLFHLKEPEKSIDYFKRVKEASKNDPVVDIYIEYIEGFIESGRKDNYVFRFNKK